MNCVKFNEKYCFLIVFYLKTGGFMGFPPSKVLFWGIFGVI